MSVLTAAAHRFDRLLNPIVVKELRQAVRSRFVSGMLILFLIVQLSVVTIALLDRADMAEDFSLSAGQEVTGVLFAILIMACLLFVPLYTGIRLTHERRDIQGDLMYTTTISPWAVIRGKLISATMLAVVIYGAFMPFMTFTYLLRGIDLPSIFLTSAMVLFVTEGATLFGMFVATLSVGTALQVLFGLGLMGALGMLASGTVSLAMALLYQGVASMAGSADFWAVAGTMVAIALGAMGLFYVLALALISPPSSNRTMPVRIYLVILLAAMGAIAWLWSVEMRDDDPMTVWAFGSAWLLCVAVVAAVGERHGYSRRVRRGIPRPRWLRPLVFLFYSGSAGGIAWCAVVAALVVGTSLVWREAYASLHMRWPSRLSPMLVASLLYAFAYGLTALLLRRALFKDPRYPLTWIITPILVMAGCFIGYLGGVETGRPWGHDWSLWTMADPFVMYETGSKNHAITCVVFAGAWALLVAAMNLPWWLGQVRQFRPLSEDEAAPAPKTNG